jgi:hypothetical protein
MTPEVQKAFDFASDTTKQLITVATGVVTATVLFSTGLDARSREWALASWIVLTVSVVFGLMTLMNLCGNLENATATKPASIYASGIRILSGIQFVLFLIGVGLVVVFGVFAARAVVPATPTTPITVNCPATPSAAAPTAPALKR